MKRKLALLVASAMVLSSVPAVSFAATTNRISNVVTGDDDRELNVNDAPTLRMYERDLNEVATDSAFAFQLDLTNAEWNVFDENGNLTVNRADFISGMTVDRVTKLSDTSIIIEGKVLEAAVAGDDRFIAVKMLADLTDEGDATVTIDPMESVLSSGTYKFATVADSSTTVTIADTTDVSENSGGEQLENIVIKETSPGAISDGELKLKLTNDWYFTRDLTGADISVYPAEFGRFIESIDNTDREDGEITINFAEADIDGDGYDDEVKSEKAVTISIATRVAYDEDEVEPGDICEMTVSGAGVDKTTLEVATAVTWGITWEAEDKTVPTMYWGQADNDEDTLTVHFEENVDGSWLGDRKTKIVFPEEVKVLDVDIDNVKNTVAGIEYSISDNEVELEGEPVDGKKAEADFTFQLSIEPGFTGDIAAVLTGSGVTTDTDQEISAVVATVAAPVTVTASSTDAVIDYRQTEIGDITITEAEAGVIKKDKSLVLQLDGGLEFDDDPVVEVTSGDLRIDDVRTEGSNLIIDIDSESSKEPSTIKVTGVNLFMERNIPAGAYSLKLSAGDGVFDVDSGSAFVVNGRADNGEFDMDDLEDDDTNAIFHNSAASGALYKETPLFNTRSVTVVDDYVNVVTAGRDQGDNTFTTQIKVTIGATEMYANDQAIALDVPAYISNGYTMLPVRAVTEALSDVAVVRWDDPTHTVTISFGERVVKMTVGSNVMVVNGVEVPMQAQCEITGERAFIPLRDMGYALGLNDSKIVWDDATKTATLN